MTVIEAFYDLVYFAFPILQNYEVRWFKFQIL